MASISCPGSSSDKPIGATPKSPHIDLIKGYIVAGLTLFKDLPLTLTITKIAEDLAAGRCSSRELVDDALARIKTHAVLNAFITLDEDAARRDAQAADRARRAGGAGILAGVPIAHKDIFCTAGVKTTCASRMLAEFVPPAQSVLGS